MESERLANMTRSELGLRVQEAGGSKQLQSTCQICAAKLKGLCATSGWWPTQRIYLHVCMGRTCKNTVPHSSMRETFIHTCAEPVQHRTLCSIDQIEKCKRLKCREAQKSTDFWGSGAERFSTTKIHCLQPSVRYSWAIQYYRSVRERVSAHRSYTIAFNWLALLQIC